MPKRNRSTFGSITKQRTGVWRLRYPDDTPDGRKRVSETVYGTRRDAEDRMAEIRLHRSPRGGAPSLISVYETLYLPYIEALLATDKIKSATFSSYTGAWRTHIAPALGRMPITKITAADIQKFLLSINKSAGDTSRNVLRGIFQQALMAGYISTNAAAGKFTLSAAGTQRSRDIYTLAELTQLDAAMRGHILEAAYLMQAHAGLRVGESLSVAVGDVHCLEVDGVSLACTHIFRSIDAHGHVAPLKTPQSDRTVALAGEWAARLLAVQDAAAAEGWRWLADDGFGAVVTQQILRRAWYRATDAAHLPRIVMRNLRPTFATSMHWQGEVPLDKLRAMLGHKAGSAVTLEHYDRPDDDDVLHARAAAELGHFRTQS